MAALAELALTRAQHVKVQMINRAAQKFKEQNCYDFEELPALAYSHQLKALVRVDRYERRSLSQRNRALRALDVLTRVPHLRSRASCWSNLFVQPVWAFNINALVKLAIESSPHALRGTLDCPKLKDLRISLRLQGDQSGHIRFTFTNTDGPSQEFAITKSHGRPGGRQWVAICPKTAKRVEYLFLKENEQGIGSRYVLGLTYRSKHSKGAPDSDSAQAIADQCRSVELFATTLPRVDELEDSRDESSLARDDKFSESEPILRSQSCAEQHQHSSERPGDQLEVPIFPDANDPSSKQPLDSDFQPDGNPSMSANPTDSFTPDCTTALNANPLSGETVEVSPVPIEVSDLKVGSALVDQGKLDEAYAVYHAIYKAELAEPSSVQAAKQADKALRRIGDLAFNYLLIGHFEQALRCVDEALSAHPKSVNLAIRRAHALMFLGRVGEARAIYRRYIGTRLAHGRSCNGLIQGDFWDLSNAGVSPSLDG